jgi:hypothetical protein
LTTLAYGSGIGGFVLSWAAEGTAFTFQKAKTPTIQMRTPKLGILTAATNELLADSSYYANELPELMVNAIGYSLDAAFRGILRADGMGRWNAPATPRTGSETMNWCVTLEART